MSEERGGLRTMDAYERGRKGGVYATFHIMRWDLFYFFSPSKTSVCSVRGIRLSFIG